MNVIPRRSSGIPSRVNLKSAWYVCVFSYLQQQQKKTFHFPSQRNAFLTMDISNEAQQGVHDVRISRCIFLCTECLTLILQNKIM